MEALLGRAREFLKPRAAHLLTQAQDTTSDTFYPPWAVLQRGKNDALPATTIISELTKVLKAKSHFYASSKKKAVK